MTGQDLSTDIAEIRAFNRFHTRLVGALNEGLLATDMPLVQVRVLYDLAHSSGLAAADLVERLGVDPDGSDGVGGGGAGSQVIWKKTSS